MNRKYNSIWTDKLLQKPSTKLNRKKFERRASFGLQNSNYLNLFKLEKINEHNNRKEKLNFNINKNNHDFNKKKPLNTINSNIINIIIVVNNANINKNKNEYI